MTQGLLTAFVVGGLICVLAQLIIFAHRFHYTLHQHMSKA